MAATNKDKPKPRLKNLDDLFQLNNGVNPLDVSVPVIEPQLINKRIITTLAIDKLTPFKGHPFRLYEGERLDDMVASIKANGVLVPIIVRKVDSTLEILAGHNRVNAAKLAGFDEIPAIVYENISDEDAIIYVIETNLIQRSFTDMTHTEKAAVIALHHSKMFSQGKRNDILEQIEMLESPHEYKENETSSQLGTKLRTDEKIGESYSLSRNTIARYLRLQYLIPALKSQLDNGDISFLPAVTLSFLKEAEQELVDDCMGRNGLSVDMKKADLLRQFSEKGKLNGESVYRILSGETTPKPNRTPIVKIDKAVYARYFKPNQPAKEVQETVEKALEMYFQ
ncbi:MAG: ParB N-terminal domain-containing protein [Oscillospiraceae bacterium]|nr:ParB N-terminal domain-containing protein [Oscillospiraceae bacterium]